MEGQYEEDIASSNSQIDSSIVSELALCKAALCFKDHEILTLRADLQAQQAISQTLSKSMERLERSLAAGMDRLARALARQQRDASPGCNTDNKRRRC